MPRKTKELEEVSVKNAKKVPTKKTTAKKSVVTKTSTKKVAKKDSLSKSTNIKPSGTTLKQKTTKRTSKKDDSKTSAPNIVSIVEYYDLPLTYNQTIVKILAQTPNMLFVYWDIADTDRKSFIEHYGNNFFKETKPVLIIHNETMNYSFEVEINDFANSWYLYINDADCKYSIELGRRPLAYVSTVKKNIFMYLLQMK